MGKVSFTMMWPCIVIVPDGMALTLQSLFLMKQYLTICFFGAVEVGGMEGACKNGTPTCCCSPRVNSKSSTGPRFPVQILTGVGLSNEWRLHHQVRWSSDLPSPLSLYLRIGLASSWN